MYKFLLTTLCIAFFSGAASAEQKKVFGQYDVHYSLINSTFISPEVAKNYGIVRGKKRALLNIAVRKRLADGTTQKKKAIVRGTSTDLIHSAQLEFREFEEKGAIYYLAEVRFTNMEMRSFNIKVQPDPNIAPYTLKFSQTLYVDK